MRVLSIRIEDPRVAPARVADRPAPALGTILALIPFGLGFLGVLTRDDRRGCHDRRAGTDVVPVDPLAPYSRGAGAPQ